jgi:hypothetical protein
LSIYPKYKIDANGLPIVEGVKSIASSRNVMLPKIDSNLDPSAMKNIITNNPGISGGAAYALSFYNKNGDDELTQKISAIEKETKETRERNQFKEAQDAANEKFNGTIRGTIWRGLKGLTRGLGVIGFTPIEIFNAKTRDLAKVVSTIKNPSAYTEKEKNQIIRTAVVGDYNSLTLFQAGKEFINTGKINLGSGFFQSESMGAGFKSREAAKKAFKIAVKNSDGTIAKDKQGRPIYRPYTVATPLAWVLTGGNPEGKTGRVIDAIGELAVGVKFDIFSKYGKYRRAKRIEATEERTVAGVKSAQSIVRSKEIEKRSAQLAKEKQIAEDSLFKVSQSTAPVKTINEYRTRIKAIIDEDVKLKDEFNELKYDKDAILSFLSKDDLNPLLQQMAEIDDAAVIYRLSRKKIPIEVAKEIAEAPTSSEVLEVLARNLLGADAKVLDAGGTIRSLGVNALDSSGLASTTTGRVLKAIPGVSKISRGIEPIKARVATGALAASKARAPFVQKLFSSLSESYNTVIPRGALVHHTDTEALVEVADSWMTVGKVPLEKRNEIINEIINSVDPGAAAGAATIKSFDAVYDAAAARGVSQSVLDNLKKQTTLFGQEQQRQSLYWASRQADGSDITVMLDRGKELRISSAHLDSEFINAHVYFPPADEVMKILGLVERLGKTPGKLAVSAADALISNFWKKSVLVRPAFVVRNIMEEQVRVFGTGHVSFYNHPMMAMGMWLGNQQGNKARKFLSRLDPYKNTSFGTPMRGKSIVEDILDEETAVAYKNQYIDFMVGFNFGATDDQLGKIISKMDYVAVNFGEKNWWDGAASQFQMLHNSKVSRAVAKIDPSDTAAVDELVESFASGDLSDLWKSFSRAIGKENADDLLSSENIKRFLFTDKNSVNGRIDELTGGLSTLRTLIANGGVTIGNKVVRIPTSLNEATDNISKASTKGRADKKVDSNQIFGKELESIFGTVGNWDNVKLTVPKKTIIRTNRKMDNMVTDAIDGFFGISVGFEKRTTMGPEWRMTYWDSVARYSSLLDEASLATLRNSIDADLKPIVNVAGVKIGGKHPAYNKLESAKGNGSLSLNDIHTIASTEASRQVAKLFYNAHDRKMLFHQLRLVMPFGQAWSDTLVKWTNIAFDNPDKIYSATRSISWLNKPESSSLYAFTDVKDVYDPNQGFFYNDEQYGGRRFFIPYGALPMNLVANLRAGKGLSTQGPYVASADPMSVNFALQGSGVLPGVGPGVTIPYDILNSLDINPVKKLPTEMQKAINDYLFPYSSSGGIQEKGIIEGGLLSNNWSRLFGAVSKREESYAGSFAPTMTYLAQGGDYNLDEPEDQGRLVKDTHTFAQWFTMFRAITGLTTLTPVSVIPTAISRDRTGNTQLATALYKDFVDLQKNATTRNEAYADFMDLYGPEAVFAIIGKTNGGATNLSTYELILQDPSVVDTYKDTYEYFYPYGGFSKEMAAWTKKEKGNIYLTPSEILNKVTQLRYYATVDRLAVRAASEGWSQERYEAGKKELSKSFNYSGLEVKSDYRRNDRVMQQLEKAAMDPRFDDSDAVAGLRDYLLLRNAALEASGMETLKNKSSLAQRKWLADQALEILERNPEFYNIYWNIFHKELKG